MNKHNPTLVGNCGLLYNGILRRLLYLIGTVHYCNLNNKHLDILHECNCGHKWIDDIRT